MKTILIFAPHFTPAFKGGGPIQSMYNLVELLRNDYSVFVYCGAKDLGDEKPMEDILVGEWNDFAPNVKAFYSNAKSLRSVNETIKKCAPDFVYINGLFSVPYNLIPLWFARMKKIRVVLAPRGMLQKGALSIRPFKKKLFLALFKIIGLHKKIRWHATDEQEKMDIAEIIGLKSDVIVASNIPKPVAQSVKYKEKISGALTMIFVSLITEKKNLHVILQALYKIRTPISFHIYGPVKDKQYWAKCNELMKNQIHEISYFGAIEATEVQTRFSEHHVMALPSKGENFGHVIYEALSVGTPVILSRFTPWSNVQNFQAGLIVDSFGEEDWARAIQTFIGFNQETYALYSHKAHELATRYFTDTDFKAQYRLLFS